MKNIFRKLLVPLLIIILGISVFLLLTATRPTAKPVTAKERVWQIKSQPAQPEVLSPTLTLYGQVETPALVNAATPGKGRVLTVAVNEGDKIEKGQFLLSLDPRDYQARVAQAKANVAELKAQIKSERLRYQADRKAYKHEQSLLNLEQAAVKRAELLKNKNLGSTAALEQAMEELERQQLASTTRKMNLDDHEARLQQLQARLDYTEAELELALLDLERSQVIAPFDGYVETLQVAAGDQVKENQVLLTLYPIDQLEVRAKIPAQFQYELQAAINRGDVLRATARIAGLPVTLQLDRLSGAADTRGIDGLFKIIAAKDLVRLGSLLTLTLQRPIQQNAILIPFSALYDNDRIYKVENGRLEGLTVQRLGEYTDNDGQVKLLISSAGIRPGDRIVVTQLPNAVTGMRVAESASEPADTL